MNRDTIYQRIADALARLKDGTLFEKCAVAIIGKAHPNLAPVQGGNDAGMDGAFGTKEGPLPLVCTIESDVIGNFDHNISTYLARRKGPRIAVVATSQLLSNTKKRNLEARAQELGLTIANIYDGAYFADQLYRDPKWRLELLGITGELPALSVLPRVGRFAEPDILIGRGEDLDWLLKTKGDVLIVGQPGSGKTFLHQHMANRGECLFAIENSTDRLADAVREQSPSTIVIDDAHFNTQLVQDVARLRAELGAQFDIHLNCWPRHEPVVQRLLGIPESRTRRLSLLRRQEIFELILHFGIDGPDWLQHLLISQAEGKPGLAVALVNVCKTDDVRHIWSGEAAARQLLGDLRLVKDETERCALAGFALGGDTGMGFSDVARALQLTTVQLRQIAVTLSSGGLIEEVAHDRLQVRPPAIRPLLVKDVFFGGAGSPPVIQLLSAVPSTQATASVLMSARQRGAHISDSLLEEFAESADTREAWEHFASVDTRCSAIVLDRHPDKVSYAASGLLVHHPHRALHALLEADEKCGGDAGAIAVRREITEWIFPFDEPSHVTVDRRQTLLAVLEERVLQHKVGDGKTFSWAVNEILDVTFSSSTLSPGNFREFTSRRGVASLETIRHVAGFWSRLCALLEHVPNSYMAAVFQGLEKWFLPQRLTCIVELSDDTVEFVRKCGREMLSDLMRLPNCNRAWRTRARTLSHWGRLELQIDTDDEYELVYGDRDHSADWQEAEKTRFAALRVIAGEMIGHPVKEIATRLDAMRAEAIEFGQRHGNGYLWVIYDHIASNCANTREWLSCLVLKESPPEFIVPFVDRIVSNADEPVRDVFLQLLERPAYYHLAISRILRMPIFDPTLLAKAMEALSSPQVAEQFQFSDRLIPLSVIRQLMKHSSPSVRAQTAIGEWHREPKGQIREELETDWEIAVRDIRPNEYELGEIFDERPRLAFAWLESRLAAEEHNLSKHDIGLVSAVKVLDRPQRITLLGKMTRNNYDDECFDLIMGEEVDLFRDWLQIQSDQYLRLRPLDRTVDLRWEQMALIALECGIRPRELEDHCLPRSWGGFGPLSEHYASQITAYEALSNHVDSRLRPAGRHGLDYVRRSAEREAARERLEDVYGYR